ncbi:dehydrodolichyl diphosphate synthase complex subunit nus1 [Condylostylus longicornis]|uniref:dehydrodolichyl diphosphate synthase complex subunit nus1 n=1 Tax=Condylostylus longicornis TaxID=2530218 RepID=UPI00244E52DF|nr:dehydrodolichyl diphosphate synthase complex subunit nus1 [Condylostylus longicornis]
MLKIIYKGLWILLVIIANVYEAVQWLLMYLDSKYKLLKQIYFNNLDGIYEIKVLEECKSILTKKPNHVCAIIGKTFDSSSEILSKLAAYALICDIDFISFYDTKEEFTLDHIHIPQFVSSQKMSNGRFLWSMPADKKRVGQLKYKNGLDKSIQVVSLSCKDGRPLLAEVCKELWLQRDSDEIKDAVNNKNKLADKISSEIQKKLNNLPDPDLVIIFDKIMCTYGLLPWNIGFSEFYQVKNSEFFNVDDFANILYKYSKCEQRFGK